MLYRGAEPAQSREMDLDDIYFLRLKLMLRTAKDCLENSDIPSVRRRVVLENAEHVAVESLALGRFGCTLDGMAADACGNPADVGFFRCAHAIALELMEIAGQERMDHSLRHALQCSMDAFDRLRTSGRPDRRLSASPWGRPERPGVL
jgi:hypothetical protein